MNETIDELELYCPPLFNLAEHNEHVEDRNVEFVNQDYLSKYQNQLAKGSWAEEEVKKDEMAFLTKCGRQDLAEKVKIVSANPDHGFDVLSYELDDTLKQIEVKSISSDNPKSFYISDHEMRKSQQLSNYYIYCVLSNTHSNVLKIYRLKNPNLNDENIFKVVPTNFEVCFI